MMKRVITFIIALVMLIGYVPVSVFAAPGDVELTNVTVAKTYKRDGNSSVLERVVIRAVGKNLAKANFQINTEGSETILVKLGDPKLVDEVDTGEVSLSGSQLVKNGYKAIATKLYISGQGLSPIEHNLTTNLPEFQYPTKPFKKDEDVELRGSNFSKIDGTNVKGQFFKADAVLDIKTPVESDTSIKQDVGSKMTGGVGVEFSSIETVSGIKITSTHNYPNAFLIISDLNVEGIKISPNRGRPSSDATLTGKLMDTNSLSVFFVEKGKDIYNFSNYEIANMVKPADEQYLANADGPGKDKFFIKIPAGINPAYYNVVLTNNVTSDPRNEINSIFLVETDYTTPGDFPMYYYVTNTAFAEIVNMTPLSAAPSSNVTIEGRNIGSLSADEFRPNKGYTYSIAEEPISDDSPVPQLTVDYQPGAGGNLGTYEYQGDIKNIDSIKRVITGDIGTQISFLKNATFTETLDTLYVRLPNYQFNTADPYEYVNIYITTTIEFDDGTKADITDRAEINPKNPEWKKVDGAYKFQYLETMFIPKIKDGGVFPDKIPVDEENYILKDLEIYITGENFVKYRYNVGGVEKIKYPLVDLGTQFIVNKNIAQGGTLPAKTYNDSFIEVYKDGRIVTGNPGDQSGNMIKIIIPKGPENKGIKIDGPLYGNPLINNPSTVVKVLNPVKTSEEITDNTKNFFGEATHPLMFVKVPGNDRPEISEIKPSPIVPAGETTKGLEVHGKNFDLDAELFIDGVKVNGAKRDDVNNIITFDAPAKLEGNYQVAVRNPKTGAVGIFNYLTYIKTSTEGLTIINYQPQKGKKDDTISVQGTSFVPPDPTVTDISGSGGWRMIGTRVLLDNEDINEYIDMDAQGNPKAHPFSPAENLIKGDGTNVVLSPDAESVILESGGKYYRLYFDYVTGRTLITDGTGEVYTIQSNNSSLSASLGGAPSQPLTQSGGSIMIGSKNFNILTVYKNENGQLTGNRVKVLSNNELVWKVPAPPEFQARLDNPYDLTVKNPDTKSFIVTDGFTILEPIQNPEITGVDRDIVSEDGGIPVVIKGKNFVNLGPDHQTKIIVDGVVVPVSQTTIGVNNDEITIIVPKYVPKVPGAKSLADEISTDRKKVTIVAQNPDGGTAYFYDFYYKVLKNRPIIKEVQPKSNINNTVEVDIFGSGFIFFEPFVNIPGGNDSIWEEGEQYTDLNGNGKYDRFTTSNDAEFKAFMDDAVNTLRGEAGNADKTDAELEKLAWERYVKPVIPKIYFRKDGSTENQEAEIIAFTGTQITAKLPQLGTGKAKIYLMNNDHSTSNEVDFEFLQSEPGITEVNPPLGTRKGGQKIQIIGQPFDSSKINVIGPDMNITQKQMPLVRFGSLSDTNISNSSIPLEGANSGKITGTRGSTQVGNLKVEYDSSGENPILKFTLTGEDGRTYTGTHAYAGGKVYLPLSSLRDADGNPYTSNEMVMINVDRDKGVASAYRIFVTRGYSKEASKTAGGIELVTPEYYKIGDTEVTVENSDGAEAKSKFKFTNPESAPKIRNILKDGEEGKLGKNAQNQDIKIITVTSVGGNLIRVIGEDFRDPSTLKFPGYNVDIPVKSYESPGTNDNFNELTFTMPALGESAIGKLIPLTITTSDNFASSADAQPPIYFQVLGIETPDMAIESVTPNKGPSTGGTEITIRGNDFRKSIEGYDGKLTVYFERDGKIVGVTDFISETHKQIVLRTPPFEAGPVDIRVVNPDGNSKILLDAFTYTSDPVIKGVYDAKNTDQLIKILSVKGGQEVIVKGEGFQEGARVLVAVKLREVKPGEDILTLEAIQISGKTYVIESSIEVDGAEFIDETQIKFTSPEAPKGSKGLVVINPDGGAAYYPDLTYGIPEIEAPFNVLAEEVFGRLIRVSWTGVSGALEYEVHVSENGSGWQQIGNTKDTSIIFEELKPNTKYKFLVRALGEYGTSKPISVSESNEVTTGATVGFEDKDGKIGDKTVVINRGKDGFVSVGKDFKYSDLEFNLLDGKLKGVENMTIKLPAPVIANSEAKIKISGKDFYFEFDPKIFTNSDLQKNKDKLDAGVTLKIGKYKKNLNTAGVVNKLGDSFFITGEQQIGNKKKALKKLNGKFEFTLDYDENLANTKRYKTVKLMRYDDAKKTWVEDKDFKTLGIFTNVGSRR